jgi:phage/plasmid-associated DNA primase
MDVIDKIMPVKDERKYLLKCLATGLDGKLLENIIFLVGQGRNGKDTIANVMHAALGDELFYNAPESLITEKPKTGPNPELAKMHMMRSVFIAEPGKRSVLNCAAVKRLTGCEIVNARGLYSSNMITRMCSSQFVMLNSLLSMDAPDDAMAHRIEVIEFRASFFEESKLAEIPEGTLYVHKVDKYYKSVEFIQRAKMPMMHILLRAYQQFHADGLRLTGRPASVIEHSRQYMAEADDFVGWFNEIFEMTPSENDFVKMKTVYDLYKRSDLYGNMNKNEKRRITKASLEKSIRSNPTLRQFHRERVHRSGIDVTSVLVKYRIRSDQNDEE